MKGAEGGKSAAEASKLPLSIFECKARKRGPKKGPQQGRLLSILGGNLSTVGTVGMTEVFLPRCQCVRPHLVFLGRHRQNGHVTIGLKSQ